MHGEQLVIGVRGNQIRLRRQQLQADQPGKGGTDKEEESDRNEIEHGDALMVAGKQPALQSILTVEIAQLRQLCILLIWKPDNSATHWFTVPGTLGAPVPDVAGLLLPAPGGCRGQ